MIMFPNVCFLTTRPVNMNRTIIVFPIMKGLNAASKLEILLCVFKIEIYIILLAINTLARYRRLYFVYIGFNILHTYEHTYKFIGRKLFAIYGIFARYLVVATKLIAIFTKQLSIILGIAMN